MPFELALAIRIISMSLVVLSAITIIFCVVKQEGNSNGVSAISGQSDTDTFYGKNSAKRGQGKLKAVTIIAAVVLAVFSIVFFIMSKI